MTAELIHIGDVSVTTNGRTPYTKEALVGPPRFEALKAFRRGEHPPGLFLWWARSSGGARLIEASEVDWESSGLL